MTNLNTNDLIKGWDRNTIASKIADDLPHSSYVNLGIGMPELVSQYIREDREIIYHSENGLLGMGPSPNENEIDLDLPPRVSIANKTDADIFVSIHANASRGKRRDINGLETFYYSGWRGRLLAKKIQKQILKVSPGSPDRGVRQGRYFVIKNTRMPAVLVEIGFLTGRLDARRLEKSIHRERIAYAITKGILEYLSRI